jgi:Protein of unknown function (DUF2934)
MSDKIQQIRERAHEIWQAQGKPEGRHVEHWLQAEQEVYGVGSDQANEGEGNKTAARAYDEAATAFAHSGSVEAAATAAAKAIENPAVAAELKEAEDTGKSRSRGEDPAVTG